MKFLVTNDDGIDAPGLQALVQAARTLGLPTVVAPKDAHSGCSHRVTTHGPIQLANRAVAEYIVDGTPADCVRLGLHRVAADAAWVLAGINSGGNLGADIYHSGTVAAVREGVLHGLPGVAVSQYRNAGHPVDWTRSAAWLAPLLAELIARRTPRGAFWNVNLPDLPAGDPMSEVVYCRLDPAPLPLSFREVDGAWHYDGNYHARSREHGADVDVCFRGQIAVTQLILG